MSEVVVTVKNLQLILYHSVNSIGYQSYGVDLSIGVGPGTRVIDSLSLSFAQINPLIDIFLVSLGKP